MKVGDLILTVFDRTRAGLIASAPFTVMIGNPPRQTTFVSVLWHTGTYESEYNVEYLEVINESR